jgi:hypothetical protein
MEILLHHRRKREPEIEAVVRSSFADGDRKRSVRRVMDEVPSELRMEGVPVG